MEARSLVLLALKPLRKAFSHIRVRSKESHWRMSEMPSMHISMEASATIDSRYRLPEVFSAVLVHCWRRDNSLQLNMLPQRVA